MRILFVYLQLITSEMSVLPESTIREIMEMKEIVKNKDEWERNGAPFVPVGMGYALDFMEQSYGKASRNERVGTFACLTNMMWKGQLATTGDEVVLLTDLIPESKLILARYSYSQIWDIFENKAAMRPKANP